METKGTVMTHLQQIGLGLSILGAFPIFVSGVLFMVRHPKVVQNFTHIEFEVGQIRLFGLAKTAIAILTLVPATSFVGIILATGWMGGAIASHVRIRDPFVVQTLVPILIWIGFGLRHADEMRWLLTM
jgi:hypothetical protein